MSSREVREEKIFIGFSLLRARENALGGYRGVTWQ
jgi:hypothetical protein